MCDEGDLESLDKDVIYTNWVSGTIERPVSTSTGTESRFDQPRWSNHQIESEISFKVEIHGRQNIST
jgi:hypothetical protein